MNNRCKLELSRQRVPENGPITSTERYKKISTSGTSRVNLKIEEAHENISPYLQKKLNQLSVPRIQYQSPKFAKAAKNCFGLLLSINKIYTQRLLFGVRALEKMSSPIALTQCPRCDHVGLSLLTTSTKQRLSPRFHQKILSILPNKPKKSNQNPSSATSKNDNLFTFAVRSPQISPQHPQIYSNILKENNSETKRQFEISNIKKNKIKANCKKASTILEFLFSEQAKYAFERIAEYEESLIEYDSTFEFINKLEKKYTFGDPTSCDVSAISKKEREVYSSVSSSCPSPIQSQLTAFKILHSRIKKVFFRRKLHIFIQMSNL